MGGELVPEPDFDSDPNAENDHQPRPDPRRDSADDVLENHFFSSSLSGLRDERENIQNWCTDLQQLLITRLWGDFEYKVEELKNSPRLSSETRSVIVNMPVPVVEAPTFLFAYLQQCTDREDLRTVDNFLGMGADPNTRNAQGETVVDMLFRVNPELSLLSMLINRGAEFEGADKHYTVEDEGKEISYTSREFIGHLAKLQRQLRIEGNISSELKEIIQHSGNLSHGYVYMRAYEEALSESEAVEDREHQGMAFLRFARQALYHQKPTTITEIVSSIEHFMDRSPQLHGWHQSEAELALLLNHPGLDYSRKEDHFVGSAITRAITSPHRVYFSGLQTIEPTGVEALKAIGLLTHSFRFLRYDTEQLRALDATGAEIQIAGSSLLEKFGFERVAPRGTDASNYFYAENERHPGFGAGYLLRPTADIWEEPHIKTLRIEPGTWIEFRRGYLLASNDNGTLVIRNSSPAFGRDGLEHFAYWSKYSLGQGLTESDLLFPEADFFVDGVFDSIFTISNFRDGFVESQKVFRLAQTLLRIKNAVKDWEFDTRLETAWSKDEITGQLYVNGSGHHFSDGFGHVVDFLVSKAEHNKRLQEIGKEPRPLPALGFFNRHLPPWMPETYVENAQGVETERSRLPVTEEVLELLQKLVRYDLRSSDDESLRATGLGAFLAMGAKKQSQLVLVAP